MIIKKIFFSLIPLVLLSLIIEISLSIFKPNVLKIDSELGWKLKENINYNLTKQDYFREKYKVNFYTDENGLRIFRVNHDKEIDIKFFVIGDSFSSEPHAGNSKMWFSEIAKEINKKYDKNTFIYSLGAGGYGTFQQLLAIKNLKKKKKLDDINFFIIQFCDNDFLNNSMTIEQKLNNLNQSARRPYYVDGKITYNNNFISTVLKTPFIGESRILNKLIFLFTKINNNKKIISQNEYEKALETTSFLLSEIKSELPNKPIFIFNCGENNNWLNTKLPKISQENNFYYLKFPKKMNLSQKNFSIDGSHWSEQGNKVIGIELFNQINNIEAFKSLFD